MAIATAARSVLRTALRGGPRAPASKRNFATSGPEHDPDETAMWKIITFAGFYCCGILIIVYLTRPPRFKEHRPHHIRNKEFPSGPDGLFEETGADGLFEEKHH